MSTRLFSARVFTLVFGIGYSVAVLMNYPLFRYYPLVNRYSPYDLVDHSLGPAMAWYGWIATGAVAAVLVTAVVPKRLGDRLPAIIFWIVPIVMLAAGWYRERSWFFMGP